MGWGLDDSVLWVFRAHWAEVIGRNFLALGALHLRNDVPMKIVVVIATVLMLCAAMLAFVDSVKIAARLRGDGFDSHGWQGGVR